MILCTFKDDRPTDSRDIVAAVVERTAARMVEIAVASKSSVCSIVGGIPLVTYPNDCRTPQERIENLVLAHADSWVRSRMRAAPPAKPDTRFDPRFECDACKIGSAREEVLRTALLAFTTLARRKLPGDEEISALASATITILQSTEIQKELVKQFEALLKP